MKPVIVVSNYVNLLPHSNPSLARTVNREMHKVRVLRSGEAQCGLIDMGEDYGVVPDMTNVPFYEDVIPKGQNHPYFENEADAAAFAATLKL